MADKSKIVFISSEEGTTCEKKMEKYKEEGKIDAGDLVLLEDIGIFVYVDSSGEDHKIGSGNVSFDNVEEVEKEISEMKAGQTVVIKNNEGTYEQYVVQETSDGKLEPIKASPTFKWTDYTESTENTDETIEEEDTE